MLALGAAGWLREKAKAGRVTEVKTLVVSPPAGGRAASRAEPAQKYVLPS